MTAVSSSTSSTDLAPMAEKSGVVRAGRIGRPHGLDGSLHVNDVGSHSLALGTAVFVEDVQYEVVRRAGTDAAPIIRLSGCESREDASAFTGKTISVERPKAAVLGPDEWWVEDLIDCEVCDGELSVGRVKGVVGLPSCEALVVVLAAGGELMVPIVSDAVRTVDIVAKLIDVDSIFLGIAGTQAK